MEQETKLCKDCKYLRPDHSGSFKHGWCVHPVLVQTDLVTGDILPRLASTERVFNCGPAAKLFEMVSPGSAMSKRSWWKFWKREG